MAASMQVCIFLFQLSSLYSYINSRNLSPPTISSYLFASMIGISLQPLQFLIISLSIFSSSFVFARRLDQYSPKTCVFNLSASHQRSNEILSFNPETLARQRQQQDQKDRSSSSLLSLKLYSRDTLNKSPFKTYRELTLSRIQREEARMSFLYSKFNQALGRNNNSSSDSLFTPNDLQAPLISGAPSLHVGEYLAQIGFGTPSKQVYTIIDTGSDVTWIPCSNSGFDLSASPSYKLLTCDAVPCQDLVQNADTCSVDNTCHYEVRYGDGTSTGGDFATDILQFGNSDIPDFPFGCDSQTEESYGILGLGRGSLSLPSQQKASSFSYCLLDRDSTAASTLDVGSVSIASDAVTAQLLINNLHQSFYYVDLTGISVGGEKLQIPASAFEIDQSSGYGGVIIDSGATLGHLFPEVYNLLSKAFVSSATGLPPPQQLYDFDICYQLTSELNNLPVIGLHFGEKTLSLKGNAYLTLVQENIYCFAFVPTNPGRPFSTIGNIQQQELMVTYDLESSLIGFSKNPNCQG